MGNVVDSYLTGEDKSQLADKITIKSSIGNNHRAWEIPIDKLKEMKIGDLVLRIAKMEKK